VRTAPGVRQSGVIDTYTVRGGSCDTVVESAQTKPPTIRNHRCARMVAIKIRIDRSRIDRIISSPPFLQILLASALQVVVSN
jgi:hypothetical protein